MQSTYILILYYSYDQDEVQPESESDDEDQQIYNPLKLPMGWDGKPIPYWLYKLHGLGQVITIYVQFGVDHNFHVFCFKLFTGQFLILRHHGKREIGGVG